MMRDYDTLARRVIRCLLDDDGLVPAFTEEELAPWHKIVWTAAERFATDFTPPVEVWTYYKI